MMKSIRLFSHLLLLLTGVWKSYYGPGNLCDPHLIIICHIYIDFCVSLTLYHKVANTIYLFVETKWMITTIPAGTDCTSSFLHGWTSLLWISAVPANTVHSTTVMAAVCAVFDLSIPSTPFTSSTFLACLARPFPAWSFDSLKLRPLKSFWPWICHIIVWWVWTCTFLRGHYSTRLIVSCSDIFIEVQCLGWWWNTGILNTGFIGFCGCGLCIEPWGGNQLQ